MIDLCLFFYFESTPNSHSLKKYSFLFFSNNVFFPKYNIAVSKPCWTHQIL